MNRRQKISQKERRRRGFIADKSKHQVEEILKSLNMVSKKEDKMLEKFRFRPKGGKK